MIVVALGLGAAVGAVPAAGEDGFDAAVSHNQAFARDRLAATTDRLSTLSTPAWPQLTGGDLLWSTTGASAWTSGFLPGALWLAYQEAPTSSLDFRARAQQWQLGLVDQAANTSTHDVGFMVFDSFGNGYRLTGDDRYRKTVLQAAASLASRYSPIVGCIRSWDSNGSHFEVIVDNMMNLELLFWASKHGGQRAWYDMAVSHARRTAANHVRPDGSTYHLVDYDPKTGAVKARRTVQGYSNSSTWARGQAWAIHGFTMTYRETRDARFLDTARRVADWFISHLPSPTDHIPYWDFDAPKVPDEPKDTSAAAIAASGLLELSTLDPDAERAADYKDAARAILAQLSAPPYLSQGSGSEAVLLHGTANKPAQSYDTGLIYGDYYFLEAMLRLRRLPANGAPLPVERVTASSADGNGPANAIDGDLATRWSAQGDGQWLRLDLGAPLTVTKVTVALYRGDQRAARFDLQASLDGTTWTTLATELSSGSTLARETYDVPDTTARYVRYLGHGTTGTTSNSVTELAAR